MEQTLFDNIDDIPEKKDECQEILDGFNSLYNMVSEIENGIANGEFDKYCAKDKRLKIR